MRRFGRHPLIMPAPGGRQTTTPAGATDMRRLILKVALLGAAAGAFGSGLAHYHNARRARARADAERLKGADKQSAGT